LMQEPISFIRKRGLGDGRSAVAHSDGADRGIRRDRVAQAAAPQTRFKSRHRVHGLLSPALAGCFAHVLSGWMHGALVRETSNFTWIHVGTTPLDLGWVLDPLSAVMLVMVTFVGLLIFIYSPATWRTMRTTRASSASSACSRVRCWASSSQQHSASLHVLGTRGTHFLPVDRLLVSQAFGGSGGQEGVSHHAGRRCFFLLGIVWLFGQPVRCSSITAAPAQ